MRRDFSRIKDKHFDVLICGGGIYGAWTAYDASLRGLKVAIVDQGDWACATSSASSKLIHGGLRYLESLDFKLVRKTLAERQMLLKQRRTGSGRCDSEFRFIKTAVLALSGLKSV